MVGWRERDGVPEGVKEDTELGGAVGLRERDGVVEGVKGNTELGEAVR